MASSEARDYAGSVTRREGNAAVVPSPHVLLTLPKSPLGEKGSAKGREAMHALANHSRTSVGDISPEPFLTAFEDLDSEISAEATLWAEHKDDTTTVKDSTKAYQTTSTPGWERDFGISFSLPSYMTSTGKATLELTKLWDGSTDGWNCSEHRLVITRLKDANYQYYRSPLSETSDTVETVIGATLQTYKLDISSLIYGKDLVGQVHLLVREKNQNCLSWFYAPDEYNGIKLKLQNGKLGSFLGLSHQ